MKDNESTKEIKRTADIVSVISEYMALKRITDNHWKGHCPFHNEKSGSFHVLPSSRIYKCFGCGESGDIFSFVQRMTGRSFYNVKKDFAERYGISMSSAEFTVQQREEYDFKARQYRILTYAAEYYRIQFDNNYGLTARDYCRKRKISRETVDKFSIGYATEDWQGLAKHLINKLKLDVSEVLATGLVIEKVDDKGGKRYYDRFRNRLMFPIWDGDGKVIAMGGRTLDPDETVKYINSPDSPLFSKSKTLYAWHLARKEVMNVEKLILTEGYMDAIALHESGFPFTAAVMGTSLTKDNVQTISRMNPRVVYLCFDGDSAGMNAILRSAKLFSEYDINARVINLPDKEDPDSFIQKHGTEAFEDAIKDSPSLAQYRIEKALAEYDLKDPGERRQGVIAAAEVLGDVTSDTEKLSYVSWMARKFAEIDQNSNSTSLRHLEDGLRRDLKIKSYSAQVQRQEMPPKKPRVPGVVIAERSLLTLMLKNPKLKEEILTSVPQDSWREGVHSEIASVLSDNMADDSEDISPLMELLSDEAADYASDCLFDESDYQVESVPHWISTIKTHQKAESRTRAIEDLKERLKRGETISKDDMAILVNR